MEELDVINEMLSTLGEAPLNQLDEDHPFVASGRRVLKNTNRRMQSRGLWFNTEALELVPDASSSFVYVPNDLLSCEDVKGTCSHSYTMRGRRLYDLTAGTFEITESPVYVRAIREIPFDDLPSLAADAVGLAAVLKFQQSYDADRQKTDETRADAMRAEALMMAEHIRQVKANYLYKTTAGGKIAAVTPFGSMRLPYPGIGTT